MSSIVSPTFRLALPNGDAIVVDENGRGSARGHRVLRHGDRQAGSALARAGIDLNPSRLTRHRPLALSGGRHRGAQASSRGGKRLRHARERRLTLRPTRPTYLRHAAVTAPGSERRDRQNDGEPKPRSRHTSKLHKMGVASSLVFFSRKSPIKSTATVTPGCLRHCVLRANLTAERGGRGRRRRDDAGQGIVRFLL